FFDLESVNLFSTLHVLDVGNMTSEKMEYICLIIRDILTCLALD
ncbi:hypothetical protein HMPREF1532_00626, partial [Bacteroides salyersiae WAL 10018 = DSM 18765 = JCM 12988]